MNDRMLDYCLKETETAVRLMARDKSSIHMFDYGTAPDGTKYVFVLAVVPKYVADAILPPDQMKPSKPLTLSPSDPCECGHIRLSHLKADGSGTCVAEQAGLEGRFCTCVGFSMIRAT